MEKILKMNMMDVDDIEEKIEPNPEEDTKK